ncbi:hypothetical protein PPERSA_07840 [Pseudocohnilembus persalinus]|uniref:Transmembrane protein n=1 Tax=Pseudocohnilembus persalinus TaxID=266149 RepID=A0A0V0QC09_PSEPJ|nr:hypothetical protein PPERSA_07840 [Pseudocohnilembus persalinus]|eukprot:KRW99763.1 hypothetical protein PPERSA_07840 [Pseudocohnilembus persalinus]
MLTQKMKTTLMQAQTAKQIKKNHQTLQNTLIQEGYLEPPKPHIQNYEQVNSYNHQFYNLIIYFQFLNFIIQPLQYFIISFFIILIKMQKLINQLFYLTS